MSKDRFPISFLTRAKLVHEKWVDTLADVKRILAKLKREEPDYLTGTRSWKNYLAPSDIWVEDTEKNIAYSVDRDFKLVEI